jgi:hypothetical protein
LAIERDFETCDAVARPSTRSRAPLATSTTASRSTLTRALAPPPRLVLRAKMKFAHSPLAPLRLGMASFAASLASLVAGDERHGVRVPPRDRPLEIVPVTSTPLDGREADYGAVPTAWGVGMIASGVALSDCG